MVSIKNTRNRIVPALLKGGLICAALLWSGCSSSTSAAKETTPAPVKKLSADQQKLLNSGKAAYMSTCIACHNADPKLAGAVGPEVAGASLEVLEEKILKGTYPEGYTPKRNTNLMVPLPHLKEQIPAIHYFLNQ